MYYAAKACKIAGRKRTLLGLRTRPVRRGGSASSRAGRFHKLDLRIAPSVRVEVDNTIATYSRAITAGDAEKMEQLRQVIETRINQLDEFYLQNEGDERATLFQKQSLRLRRALHSAPPNASPERAAPAANTPAFLMSGGAAPMSSSPNAASRETSPEPRSRSGTASSVTRNMSIMDRPATLPREAPDVLSRTPSPGSAKSKRMSVTDFHFSRYHRSNSQDRDVRPPSWSDKSKPSEGKKKAVKPLYAWEKPKVDEGVTAPKPRVERDTDMGVFVPSAVNGFYEQQDAVLISPRYVDLRIVLDPNEYELLTSMRRARAVKDTQQKRFQRSAANESEFLHSSAPYVDPARVGQKILTRGP